MSENPSFKPPKDLESIYSLYSDNPEAFFEWEKENPDDHFYAILGFVFEDDTAAIKEKLDEYQAAENKDTYRLKFYLTLQIAFDQEIKRRGLHRNKSSQE